MHAPSFFIPLSFTMTLKSLPKQIGQRHRAYSDWFAPALDKAKSDPLASPRAEESSIFPE